MYIYELPENTQITITCKMKNSNKLEWKRNVKKTSIKSKCVYIPPILQNEKMLSFNVTGIIIEITALHQKEPIIFKNCSIGSAIINGVKYHSVICPYDSIKENRRTSNRFFINEICDIQYQNTKQSIKGVIKDMSESGFSCMILPKDEPRIDLNDNSIQINYFDNVIQKEINLIGKIVRRENVTDGILYGVHTNEYNMDVLRTLKLRELT